MKQKPEGLPWRYVTFFRWFPSEGGPPVYHYWKTSDNGDVPVLATTECGRAISDYADWMPERHAATFARPCKGCFDVE